MSDDDLEKAAYLNWQSRGEPDQDPWNDWFEAERLRKKRIRESAYFHWESRGWPPNSEWDDWFWAERQYPETK